MTDWIATFPSVFQESQRGVLETVERSGFEKGIQRAARVAAFYAIEDPELDSVCREIAREITTEGANLK